MTTPERTVEEIVEERVARYGMAYKGILPDELIERSQEHWRNELLDFADAIQAERQRCEEMVEHAMWNLNAKIEEADFARKVGEKTGNAEAVYEVQDIIRQIKAITQPNNP